MEQEIKRRELIRVATAAIKEKEYQGKVSQYLEFTTKQGATWRITAKREALWGMFVPGKAIELSVAEYKDKEYIAHAEENLTPPGEGHAGVEPAPQPPHKTDKDKQISEAVAYKALNLHIAKDQMEKIFGDEAAGLLVWYKDKTLEWAYRK